MRRDIGLVGLLFTSVGSIIRPALHRRDHLAGRTGLLYTGTSSRLTYSLARMRFIPEPFARLSPRGVPLIAIAFSFLCGMVVSLPFPGWQQLVGFVSDATVVAYGMAPLALGALRSQDADRERPYRLPAAGILPPLAFAAANEVILFSGWPSSGSSSWRS